MLMERIKNSKKKIKHNEISLERMRPEKGV